MIDHVSLQVADIPTSTVFYDAVLAPLGGHQFMNVGTAVGYGTDRPIFWIGKEATSEPQKEVHVAFTASDRAAVVAFRDAAAALGAEVLHEPRVFPEYHENYYGAFVRDPDGNNVEAVCHLPG